MNSRRFLRPCVWGLLALAAGCATLPEEPVTPVSYSSVSDHMARTVGRLRRLAVLQLDQDPPPGCTAGSTEAARLVAVNQELRRDVLVARRGYEVVALDPEVLAAWPSPPSPQALAEEVKTLADTPSAARPQGPSLRALLERLAREKHIDGLLVLHGQPNCPNVAFGMRGVMALATLGLSEKWPDENLHRTFPTWRAWVLECRGQRVVWRAQSSPWTLRSPFDAIADRPPPSELELLFETLEPAVPKLLTR